MEWLKWLLVLASLPILYWLIRRTIYRARELNAGIDKYHEEQKALQKLRDQGLAAPANPYADLAELYADDKEENGKQ